MYYAITILDGKITAKHESGSPITDTTFDANPEFAGQEVIETTEASEYASGFLLAEFTADGVLRPLIDRINDGLATVPDGMKLIDGQLVADEVPPEAETEGVVSAMELIDILLGGSV